MSSWFTGISVDKKSAIVCSSDCISSVNRAVFESGKGVRNTVRNQIRLYNALEFQLDESCSALENIAEALTRSDETEKLLGETDPERKARISETDDRLSMCPYSAVIISQRAKRDIV